MGRILTQVGKYYEKGIFLNVFKLELTMIIIIALNKISSFEILISTLRNTFHNAFPLKLKSYPYKTIIIIKIQNYLTIGSLGKNNIKMK